MKFSFFRSILAVVLNKNSEEAFNKAVSLELYQKLLIVSLTKTDSISGILLWKEISKLFLKVEAQLLAQLAVYFRENLKYRWITLALLVKWSGFHQGDSLIGQTTNRIIQGPEDILDLLTYYQAEIEPEGEKKLHKLSKQIQKGIAAAFCELTKDQLVFPHRQRSVTLKDALLLTHPKAQDEAQVQLFEQILTQKPSAPLTWKEDFANFSRQQFSTAIAKKDAVKKKWERWILADHLSYFDLLRHLRTILKIDLSEEALRKVGTRIADPLAIQASKRLPFFFVSEYRKIESLEPKKITSKVLDALEEAKEVSGANLLGFPAGLRVLLAMDRSSKMYQTIGRKNKLRYWDIGMIVEETLKKRQVAVITRIFGENTNENPFVESTVTQALEMIETLIAQKRVLDKILIFSSQQEWEAGAASSSKLATVWKKYKRRIAPQAQLYSFDLLDYRQLPIRLLPKEVYLIAGWSERIFEVLSAIENGEEALSAIKTIET